jgi:outer membrane protein OmpA-like peptidoglycan-associated protein
MEVVAWEGRRWLRINSSGAFAIPLPEVLPERFTAEFDVTIPWPMFVVYTGALARGQAPGYLQDRALVMVSQFYQAGVVAAGGQTRSTLYPEKVLPATTFTSGHHLTAPVRVRVHADGAYVKVYLEEHRVANMPRADLLRADKLVFHFTVGGAGGGGDPPLITNLSVNAGGQPMYDALMADGRFVTQGIFFDTGSDRLRPESTPTLEEIAAMLEAHADLRLRVEGHTDSVGDDAANQELSERRAASMKAYLVTEKHIDADRLEAHGLGETTPAAPNDTPEGRQQNRRVELVKL